MRREPLAQVPVPVVVSVIGRTARRLIPLLLIGVHDLVLRRRAPPAFLHPITAGLLRFPPTVIRPGRRLAEHVRLKRPRLRVRPAAILDGRPWLAAVLHLGPMPGVIRLAWRLRLWIARAGLRRPRVPMARIAWLTGRPGILVHLVARPTWRPRLRIPGSALLRGGPLFQVTRAALLRGRPLLWVARTAQLRGRPLLVTRAAVPRRPPLRRRPLLRVTRAALLRHPLLRRRPLLCVTPVVRRRPGLSEMLAGHPRIGVALPFLVLGWFLPAAGVVTLLGPGVVIGGAGCRSLMLVLHPSAAH